MDLGANDTSICQEGSPDCDDGREAPPAEFVLLAKCGVDQVQIPCGSLCHFASGDLYIAWEAA